MKEINFKRLTEPFPEDCIEWRVAQAGNSVGKPWAQVLAYISARACQDRLDEVFGVFGWRVEYEFIDTTEKRAGGVFAHIDLWDEEKKCWIRKTDGAEQTDFEAFKGGISGAFKRAASLIGIGRYLYDLESGFAQIVEKGTRGARYNNSKTRSGEQIQFYWVPPRLPEWALPKK